MDGNNEIEKYDHLKEMILEIHRDIDDKDLKINNESIFKIISCPLMINPDENEEIYYNKSDARFERLIINRKILRDYKNGLAIKRIAQKYDISAFRVQQIIKYMVKR